MWDSNTSIVSFAQLSNRWLKNWTHIIVGASRLSACSFVIIRKQVFRRSLNDHFSLVLDIPEAQALATDSFFLLCGGSSSIIKTLHFRCIRFDCTYCHWWPVMQQSWGVVNIVTCLLARLRSLSSNLILIVVWPATLGKCYLFREFMIRSLFWCILQIITTSTHCPSHRS